MNFSVGFRLVQAGQMALGGCMCVCRGLCHLYSVGPLDMRLLVLCDVFPGVWPYSLVLGYSSSVLTLTVKLPLCPFSEA